MSEREFEFPLLWKLIDVLEFYYLPALVVFGSLGNILSAFVVLTTNMKRSSSSYYLAALAISDTGFLVSQIVAWLALVNIDLHNRYGFCQFFVFLTSLCSFLSAWWVIIKFYFI